MALGGPQPDWRIGLCSHLTSAYANNATFVGEIQGARERQFGFMLNRPGTVSFKLDLDAPFATDILAQKQGLITLYRKGVLAMTAEIQSVEAIGQEGDHSIQVNAVETMWVRLQKSLIGITASGYAGPTSATDQGTWLVSTVLALMNGGGYYGFTGKTGINAGTVTASGNIAGGTWRFKPFMELMQELAASTSGFDFWQTPRDPLTQATTGLLNIAPVKGAVKTNVVFEYGTGAANASAYRFVRDASQQVNYVHILPPGFPDSAGLKLASTVDGTNLSANGRLHEVVSSELNALSMRQTLADENVAIRKNPREQFFITPAAYVGDDRVPEPLVDYTTGDIVRGRVLDQGLSLVDAQVRIYGIVVSPTDEGMEEVELVLVNES